MTFQRRPAARAKVRPRHETGKMNKTEAAYARWLQSKVNDGTLAGWWFEGIKLRVADGTCWWSADFLVQGVDGSLEIHDVKGGPTEDDALVKSKVIATQFPFPVFEVRAGKGGWKIESVV